MRLEELHSYQISVYMYKTIFLGYDNDLLFSLSPTRDVHSYNTRNNSLFIPPLFKHNKSQNSIEY